MRIECFDISNIQGESPVGSMVVFQDAVPKKAHYRKFGVRGLERAGRLRGDRRGGLAPLRAAGRTASTADEYDESFAAMPNLVVIDGGKGQLSAALAAMQALDLPRVAVISLAKREEEVFVPGPAATRSCSTATRRGSSCSSGSATRRTASRSASTASAATRRRASRSSTTLQGVGPARRRALLQHFGSAERFLAASQEELEGVPGVPAKTARAIYAQLHKAGRA